MNRKIKPISYTITPEAVSDPQKAMDTQISSGRYRYLLAHAIDGVIWGIIQDGHIKVADFPGSPHPKLRMETLQQARLFGPEDEWLVWRTPEGWKSRLVHDHPEGESGGEITENWILWGTDLEKAENGFSLVREADLGIRHAPPIKFLERHKLYLRVRHYIQSDSEGAACVQFSRLVDLNNGGEK
jgi:CRISPR-associated protein (TIGR03984 family)